MMGSEGYVAGVWVGEERVKSVKSVKSVKKV